MRYILLALTFFTLNATAQVATINQPSYAYSYPAQWDTARYGEILAVLTPLEGGSDDFAENLNVVVQPTSLFGGVDLAGYVNINIKQLEDLGIDDIKRADYVVGAQKLKGQMIVYTTDKFSQGTMKQVLWQLFVLYNNKYFVVSYSSTPATFEKYLPQMQKVVSTIVFK